LKLFGITGGVGMGKSTAGELLRQLGVAVTDTDLIARQLVEPGQPALAEIVEKFGPSLISGEGRLNRSALARRVFGEVEARAVLERILHPRIRAIWEAETAGWRDAGRAHGAVIIPLLFETKAAPIFDAVVCVACSERTREERLAERGWSRREIQQRCEAQWPVEQKAAQSDFVVWTETTLPAHAAQLERLVFSR
jgi:dephospho-CoA kinase